MTTSSCSSVRILFHVNDGYLTPNVAYLMCLAVCLFNHCGVRGSGRLQLATMLVLDDKQRSMEDNAPELNSAE